jgi:hypothetical protein
MMRFAGRRAGSGFVAIEFVVGIALLMIPVVVLVSTLPGWAERRHAAAVAAGEAAKYGARSWPRSNDATARAIAHQVLANRGIPTRDARVSVTSSAVRGGRVTVRVSVLVPGFRFGDQRVASWWVTVERTERIDDYRSR